VRPQRKKPTRSPPQQIQTQSRKPRRSPEKSEQLVVAHVSHREQSAASGSSKSAASGSSKSAREQRRQAPLSSSLSPPGSQSSGATRGSGSRGQVIAHPDAPPQTRELGDGSPIVVGTVCRFLSSKADNHEAEVQIVHHTKSGRVTVQLILEDGSNGSRISVASKNLYPIA
jgi:hypothetical protein